MASEGRPSVPLRLKVEINTRERFALDGWQEHPYSISSQWHSGSAKITTFTLEELLGTKLRALYQRKKGRDLLDLSLCITTLRPDLKKVITCFLEYMDRGGYKITAELFKNNLDDKMKDRRFTQDISPLLRPELSWNLGEAMGIVRSNLLAGWA